MRRLIILSLFVTSIWGSPPIEPTPLKNIVPRIINGDDAVLGQLPWQVGILGQASTGAYFCGGSLISEEWVLTAGHCIDGATSAVIYSGTVKISDPSRLTSRAASFILHEKYNPSNFNNDIGLIRLSKPLIFNENTKAIALAIRDPKTGTNVTVSGWGLTSDSDIYVSDDLYYTTVSTIENSDCAKIYGFSVVGPGVMCASTGNPHTSPCQGDSGAPVVVLNSCNKPVQVGVFSFVNGYGCEYSFPSGNTRVSHYREWIREKTDVRIINGERATLGQFPWQAALFMQEGPNSDFWFCGGSIIGEEWILTAGHCVDKAQSALVYTGIIDISGEISLSSFPKTFILHDGYNATTLANDIGLVKLPESLTFDNNTKAIELSSEILGVDIQITVSGWGKTSDNNTSISNVLNYVNLSTISNEECQAAYGTKIFPEMVCALGENIQSPCSGDSGGPVVVDASTNPKQVAITSFVSDLGCQSGTPSGYTRTTYYRDWIKSKTNI
ncbi:brachyurin [Asbolus verrucosus]|uniref:Brachyurin n=1 Tax=Asbolus verrucosus TaxID=1661398 RepID=A0A482VYR2_ASBVE|nr:brachyurin [Asbolus verrucosus]